MKKALAIVIIVLGVAGVLWVAKAWTPRRVDPKILKFNADADNLILGLQQYREFVGSYPTGNNVTIAKALLGRTRKEGPHPGGAQERHERQRRNPRPVGHAAAVLLLRQ